MVFNYLSIYLSENGPFMIRGQSTWFFVVPVMETGEGGEALGTWFRCVSLDSAFNVARGFIVEFSGVVVLKGLDRPVEDKGAGRNEETYTFVARFGDVPEHLLQALPIEKTD